MDSDEFYEKLEEATIASGLSSLYVPFGTPSVASEVTFRGFGIAVAGEAFRTGWQLEMEAGSNAKNMVAFTTGTIRLDTAASGARIILESADFLGGLGTELPEWFPRVAYVIYQNLDWAETETKLKEYLTAKPEILESLNRLAGASGKTAADFAAAFVNADTALLPTNLYVEAGTVIGVAASSGASTRSCTISMQSELDNADNLFLDPAVYHDHSSPRFVNLSGHPLEASLKKPFAGPVANGIVRYVQSGSTATGDFTSSADPAGSVAAALAVAKAHDSILILDSETYYYTNNLIHIETPVNITSLSSQDATTSIPTTFPKLSGRTSTGSQLDLSVVWVDEVTEGIVSICNVEILHGHPAALGMDILADIVGGGGILIAETDPVYIRNCYIHSNTIVSDDGQLNGFGGGIYCYVSSAYIYKNRITNNTSGARGGGIGVGGYGWPIIASNLVYENTADGDRGRGDGGGIGCEISFLDEDAWDDYLAAGFEYFAVIDDLYVSRFEQATYQRAKILNNKIYSNVATDDGGGVYASVQSYILMEDNEIYGNTANESGGGVRITYGSNAIIRGDYIHSNRANCKTPDGSAVYEHSGGGGVSIQSSKVEIENTRIEENMVVGSFGGGLFIHSINNNPDPDYWTVLEKAFDFTRCEVRVTGYDSTIKANVAATEEALEDRRGGGGIAIDRRDEETNGSLSMYVMIENYEEVVHDNSNDYVFASDGSQYYDTSTEYLNAVNMYLTDQVNRPTEPVIDDTNVSSCITGSVFEYGSN